MKTGILQFCSIILILLFASASACVAPPKPTGAQSSVPGGASSGPDAGVTTDVTTPVYVTMETPFGATPQKTATPTETTATPEEWVEIYRDIRPYGYNSTAFSFNLKNPPMIINFSVVPVNVTGTKVVTSKFGAKEELTVPYDYYSPYSWFVVTIRNKNTGQILKEDGFQKQYSADVNRTIKVLNPGNLHIEMGGNQITAMVNMHVKKEGNINLSVP